MVDEKIDMSKEKSCSSKYYDIFKNYFENIKTVENCCIVGLGNFAVISNVINDIKNKVKHFTIIDEYNVIVLSKMMINDVDIECINIVDFIKNKSEEFECMNYDLVIGNPPYKRDLHLKILDKVYYYVKDGGEIVWLAPVVRLTNIRNLYHDFAINKFFKYNHIWKNVEDLKIIPNFEMNEIFHIASMNATGILKIKKETESNKKITADKFIQLTDYYKNKIKHIIEIFEKNRFNGNPKNIGTFQLNIPWLHGNHGKKDFYAIFSFNYENALEYKSNLELYEKGERNRIALTKYNYPNHLYFETENDRHNYWKFWTSDFGRFLVSLWKIDSNIYSCYKFIPYLWWETEEEAKKFFDITDEEIEEISKITMTNDK